MKQTLFYCLFSGCRSLMRVIPNQKRLDPVIDIIKIFNFTLKQFPIMNPKMNEINKRTSFTPGNSSN